MSKKKETLADVLQKTADETIVNMYYELFVGDVSNKSLVHQFVWHLNKRIDQGAMLIEQGKYRHIYMPTFRRALNEEMARRYCQVITGKRAQFQVVQNPFKAHQE